MRTIEISEKEAEESVFSVEEITALKNIPPSEFTSEDRDRLAEGFVKYVEENDKVPTVQDLPTEGFPFSRVFINNRFGPYNNLVWRSGYPPNRHTRVQERETEQGGETELIEHELRGLQWDLKRVPATTDVKEHKPFIQSHWGKESNSCGSFRQFLSECGLPPYENISLSREYEERIVGKLFQDEEISADFLRDESQNVSTVIAAYVPWMNEERSEKFRPYKRSRAYQDSKQEVYWLYELASALDKYLDVQSEAYDSAEQADAVAITNKVKTIEEAAKSRFSMLADQIYDEDIRRKEDAPDKDTESIMQKLPKTPSFCYERELTGIATDVGKEEYHDYSTPPDVFQVHPKAQQRYEKWVNKIGPQQVADQYDRVISDIVKAIESGGELI